MGQIIENVSTQEALDLGNAEGKKQILSELLKELDSASELSYIKAYVKARLASIKEQEEFRARGGIV